MSFNRKKNKLVIILAHLFAWLLLISIPVLLKPTFGNRDVHLIENEQLRIKAAIALTSFVILWIGIFYMNAMVFMPRFLKRKKISAYIISIASSLVLLFIADIAMYFILNPGLSYNIKNILFLNSYPFIFIMVASSAYRLVVDRVAVERGCR